MAAFVSKESSEFKPSIKIVTRILKTLQEQSSIGRSGLVQLANLNHVRLTRYIGWLEKMAFIEYVISDGKLKIRITANGREFVEKLQRIEN